MSPINRKAGISDALPSEEVLRSLNINVLHQSLSQFGIIEVSPEVCCSWNISFKNVHSWHDMVTRFREVLKWKLFIVCYLIIKISLRVRILWSSYLICLFLTEFIFTSKFHSKALSSPNLYGLVASIDLSSKLCWRKAIWIYLSVDYLKLKCPKLHPSILFFNRHTPHCLHCHSGCQILTFVHNLGVHLRCGFCFILFCLVFWGT